MYIWDYREDGKLVVRAIPFTEDTSSPCPVPQVVELKQKVG